MRTRDDDPILGGPVFTKTSRTDKAREQVADAAGTVGDTWRDKVAPTVGAKARDARDWAAPHVEHGRRAAAPKVEAAIDAAADKVSPAVDAAREKIDDWMPRVLEAVAAAATAGAAAGATAGEYRSRSGDAVAVLKGNAIVKPKRGRVLRKLLIVPVIAAAGAAAFAVFKSRSPKDDPWAVPTGTYPAYTAPVPAAVPTVVPAVAPAPDLSSGRAADALDADAPAEVPGVDTTTEPTDRI